MPPAALIVVPKKERLARVRCWQSVTFSA